MTSRIFLLTLALSFSSPALSADPVNPITDDSLGSSSVNSGIEEIASQVRQLKAELESFIPITETATGIPNNLVALVKNSLLIMSSANPSSEKEAKKNSYLLLNNLEKILDIAVRTKNDAAVKSAVDLLNQLEKSPHLSKTNYKSLQWASRLTLALGIVFFISPPPGVELLFSLDVERTTFGPLVAATIFDAIWYTVRALGLNNIGFRHLAKIHALKFRCERYLTSHLNPH